MKFNIGTKVNLLIIVALLLVGVASVFVSVSSLKSEGEISIQTYSNAIMNEKKSQIKDLVNSALPLPKSAWTPPRTGRPFARNMATM